MFAKAPIGTDGTGIEAVTDSSRYFVIKIVDASTSHHAWVGLGFSERSDSFDMNVAIQDHLKFISFINDRRLGVGNNVVARPSGPIVDYSLKEGQKISIIMGGSGSVNSENELGSQDNNGSDLSKCMIIRNSSFNRPTSFISCECGTVA